MKKIEKLENDAKMYAVIGAPGTGKTSIVRSFVGKKVVLSFDESYSSLKGTPDLVVYSGFTAKELVDTDKFIETIDKLSSNADLLVFDNISALEDLLVDEITDGNAGNNTNLQAAYGATQKVLRKIARWSMLFHGTVLFTLWSQNKDGKEVPAMNEKAFNAVAGLAKIVGRTFIDEEKKYSVSLQPDFDVYGKNTVNKIEVVPNEKFWKATTYREPVEKKEVKK